MKDDKIVPIRRPAIKNVRPIPFALGTKKEAAGLPSPMEQELALRCSKLLELCQDLEERLKLVEAHQLEMVRLLTVVATNLGPIDLKDI